MSELNKEQIIKALECCSGTTCKTICPLSSVAEINCGQLLIKESLALIKELTEENFLLKQKRVNMFEILDAYGRGRADTVRKFVIYLKEHSFMCDPGNGFSFDAIDVDELGDYVKRFLEEDK